MHYCSNIKNGKQIKEKPDTKWNKWIADFEGRPHPSKLPNSEKKIKNSEKELKKSCGQACFCTPLISALKEQLVDLWLEDQPSLQSESPGQPSLGTEGNHGKQKAVKNIIEG